MSFVQRFASLGQAPLFGTLRLLSGQLADCKSHATDRGKSERCSVYSRRPGRKLQLVAPTGTAWSGVVFVG